MSANYASARSAVSARVEVVAAYPITPATTVPEQVALLSETGVYKGQFIRVESEHSAIFACIGASSTGARTFTATSSNGLLLMDEGLHWASAARAIENQVYVAAVNRIGTGFDNKTYFGHSQVVDPWGVVLTRINSEGRIITSRRNTDMIQSVRNQITCYADRSPTGYDKVKWFRE